MNTTAIAAEVRAEIERLQKVLDLLEEGSTSGTGRGRRKGKMSAAGRAKIAAAQRKRWAELKKQKAAGKKS